MTGAETFFFFLLVVGVAIAITRAETKRECEAQILGALSEFYGLSVPELRARLRYQAELASAPREETP